MKSYWYILLVPAALLVAWISIAHDPREQTAMLEKVAQAIEQAQVIPPETEYAIKETLASVRRGAMPTDEQLAARQRQAIGRIEAVLSAREFAQTSGIAGRAMRHYVPSE